MKVWKPTAEHWAKAPEWAEEIRVDETGFVEYYEEKYKRCKTIINFGTPHKPMKYRRPE